MEKEDYTSLYLVSVFVFVSFTGIHVFYSLLLLLYSNCLSPHLCFYWLNGIGENASNYTKCLFLIGTYGLPLWSALGILFRSDSSALADVPVETEY